MPPFLQKTVVREGFLEGVGIHSGEKAKIFLSPLPPDSGIQFFKDGRFVEVLGKAERSAERGMASRCSSVGEGPDRILTVEHLLAAAIGMGVTNLKINIQGNEIPGVDGSSLPFVQLFKELGVKEQEKEAYVWKIREPIFCSQPMKAVAMFPADRLEISYVLDYPHPHLKNQKADFVLTAGTFENEIASARTFCTEKEARELTRHGFGLGANPENTVVVREDGAHLKSLRSQDECVRHKILDILGDLSFLGNPVVGRIVALRSGHSLNHELVKAIRRQA